MSRRTVMKVAPISATSPSTAVDIAQTTSITSDPENSRVAKRQSAITAHLEQRHVDCIDQHRSEPAGSAVDQSRTSILASKKLDPAKGKLTLKLSGESERIGEGDWDQETPFGKHVGYL